MSQNFRERFYVHAALNGTGGEGMAQRMKAFVRYTQFYKEQFESTLIGTDENGLAV